MEFIMVWWLVWRRGRTTRAGFSGRLSGGFSQRIRARLSERFSGGRRTAAPPEKRETPDGDRDEPGGQAPEDQAGHTDGLGGGRTDQGEVAELRHTGAPGER